MVSDGNIKLQLNRQQACMVMCTVIWRTLFNRHVFSVFSVWC